MPEHTFLLPPFFITTSENYRDYRESNTLHKLPTFLNSLVPIGTMLPLPLYHILSDWDSILREIYSKNKKS